MKHRNNLFIGVYGLSEASWDEIENALAVVAFGQAEREEEITKKVKRVMATVEWHKPEAGMRRKILAGNIFNDIKAKTEIEFCADGLYVFQSKNTSSHESRRTSHNGKWRFLANLVGESIIKMDSTKGRSLQWSFQEIKSGVKINGIESLRSQSQDCT